MKNQGYKSNECSGSSIVLLPGPSSINSSNIQPKKRQQKKIYHGFFTTKKASVSSDTKTNRWTNSLNDCSRVNKSSYWTWTNLVKFILMSINHYKLLLGITHFKLWKIHNSKNCFKFLIQDTNCLVERLCQSASFHKYTIPFETSCKLRSIKLWIFAWRQIVGRQ